MEKKRPTHLVSTTDLENQTLFGICVPLARLCPFKKGVFNLGSKTVLPEGQTSCQGCLHVQAIGELSSTPTA